MLLRTFFWLVKVLETPTMEKMIFSSAIESCEEDGTINIIRRFACRNGIRLPHMNGVYKRGGNPTCKDRVFASAMGTMAVELLCEGKSNRVVGYKEGEFVDFDIQEALSMSKDLDPYLFHITHKLTTR